MAGVGAGGEANEAEAGEAVSEQRLRERVESVISASLTAAAVLRRLGNSSQADAMDAVAMQLREVLDEHNAELIP